MRYVVDSCVAIKWELPEDEYAFALRVRAQRVARTIELIAPDFLPLEIAHALSRAERRGFIRPPDGAQMLRRIIQEVNAYFPSLPLLARVYEISSAARIGFYDCVYLSLAEQQGCKMITSDLKLRIFPQVVLLSDFP